MKKKLLTQTYEGITLRPVYDQEDVDSSAFTGQLPGQADYMRGIMAAGYHGKLWEISQELPYGTPQEVNEALRQDLADGQTEIHILTDLVTQLGYDPDHAKPSEVGACGVSLSNIQDFDTLFKGIDIGKHSIYLRGGPSALSLAILFFAWAEKYEVKVGKLHGCLESDPYGFWAATGRLPVSLDKVFEEVAILTKYVTAQKYHFQTVTVSTTAYHDAGGSGVQELALAMASGVGCLRRLAAHGIPVDQVAPRMQFAFSVGTNFFMELAKLRAARLLWAKVVEACGGREESRRMWIHARTAIRDKTIVDAHNNILRGTTEAFAAVLGQCNSLHVSPYDEVYQAPDAFSRRVARNIQLILRHECMLTEVIDPAGGSWFVETLTKELAQKAWEQFQQIEKDGGIEAGLRSGSIQRQIAALRDQRAQNAGSRKDVVVGVNNYPNPKEKLPEARPQDWEGVYKKRYAEITTYRQGAEPVEDSKILGLLAQLNENEPGKVIETAAEAALLGASLGELSRVIRKGREDGETIEKLPIFRPSHLYETLRQRCEAIGESKGVELSVLQLNIGPSREYRARADWTTNFLMVGGLRVHADKDFATVKEAIAAAAASPSHALVICSTDEKYAQVVPEIASGIKSLAAKKLIFVAGAPGDQEAAWKSAGVDGFINVRIANHPFLESLISKLEALV